LFLTRERIDAAADPKLSQNPRKQQRWKLQEVKALAVTKKPEIVSRLGGL